MKRFSLTLDRAEVLEFARLCICLLPMEVFSNADIFFCFSHSEEVLEFCETLFGYLPLLQWKCSWLIRFCRIIIVREEVLEFARL